MHTNYRRNLRAELFKQAGLTLTELLVALVLGLFLMGGVISLFTSNQSNFKANENLARLQESARFAVEQLSREIRDAGTTPCGIRAVNSVIRQGGVANTSIPWWADWNAGVLRGFDDATTITGMNSVPFGTNTTGTRAVNTDGISTLRTSLEEEAMHTVQTHNTVSATITLDRAVTRYVDGQLLMMCDGNSGVIFHLTSDPAGGTNVDYGNTTRRNCSTQMGWTSSVNCDTSATHKQFQPGAFVTKYDPAFWYVGYTGVGDQKSLYRATVTNQNIGGLVPNMTRREMVPDVSDMQIEYLTRTNPASSTGTAALSTSWIPASDTKFDAGSGAWSPANLNEAVAVRITLTLTSKENVGTNAAGTSSEKLTRQSVFLISLRNREIVPQR
jgi:type IV pilus assembly protein PilW